MKSRQYSGILLICVGIFFLYGAGRAEPSGKNAAFRSAYVAPANPHPKIASSLRQAMDFTRKSTRKEKEEFFKTFSPQTPPPFRLDAQNRLQCYVKCVDVTSLTLEKLKKYGIPVQYTDPRRRLVQTRLSVDQIRLLETLPEVKFIQLPNYPVAFVGSVTTEGYEAMHIDNFVSRPEFVGTNVTGRGMKVGVISTAIYLADLSSENGDLPPSTAPPPGAGVHGGVFYYSFRTNPFTTLPYGTELGGIITYWTGNYDEEGTAMLEIIHDIVPDAALYFSNFDTDLEMNMCKDWLRQQGCDVIVDDIGWYNAGPYDGTSTVSMGSTRQVENGTAYYTSVGNGAEKHWWGYFQDKEPNNFNNFSPLDESIEVRIFPGSSVSFHLSWDEPWGEAGYDIDMYILDPDFLDISNPYSFSTNLQLGDGDPAESCSFANFAFESQVVSIVINRKPLPEPYDDVNNPMRMNLHVLGGGEIVEKDHMIREGSISNNSDAGGGVISVAAIDVSSRLHNVVEYYSSRGPTWDGRIKPEITCFDGTSSGRALWGTSFYRFFGTSCSAPHAAAIAAMIKGYKVSMGDPDFINPWTPKEVVDNINTAIFQGAEDLLPVGVDTTSGYGRINAENVFLNFLDPSPRRKVYDFAKGTDDWQFVGIPKYYTEPLHSHENGKLILQSQDHNTFGYWESPMVEFSDGSTTLDPSKIYVARFLISTTTLPDKYPGFRLRANGMRDTTAYIRDFNSNTGNNHYPGTTGTDYYLTLRPTNTEAMNGIRLSLDIVNFNTNDDPVGILYLDEVDIVEYDIP